MCHSANPPLIRLERISKSFGTVTALENITLELCPNEVIGLIGDNGAGKTTLVNILSGVDTADGGRFEIRGHPISLKTFSVSKARAYGIETVHQDRALGERQPIWRNFFMGRHLTNRLGMIREKEEKQETLKVLRDILSLEGAGLAPDSPVSVLSGGERQGLAIGRAIYFDSDIIILDEPCTALAVREVSKVLSFIRKIRESGKSAIFISHNLSHAFDVADRFVILNHGQVVMSVKKEDTDLVRLTRVLMAMSDRL